MMLSLLAQVVQMEPTYQAWSPDWWFQKFERYGWSTCITIITLVAIVKYGPRAVRAILDSINTNTASTKALTEVATKQQIQTDKIVITQEATVANMAKLVEMHQNMCEREEAIVSRACDLVETATLRFAPSMIDEVKIHTHALRSLTHQKPKT